MSSATVAGQSFVGNGHACNSCTPLFRRQQYRLQQLQTGVSPPKRSLQLLQASLSPTKGWPATVAGTSEGSGSAPENRTGKILEAESVPGNLTSKLDAPKSLAAMRAGKNVAPTQPAGNEVPQQFVPMTYRDYPASANDTSAIARSKTVGSR